MLKMLILLGVTMCLAYCSQHGILVVPLTKKHKLDIPLIAIIVALSLVTGLRTEFNDTGTYIASFKETVTLEKYIDSSPGLLDYPLFYGYQSFFRHYISDNPHLFLLSIAIFTNASFILFIRKHSDNFAFSILIFFALGLYVSTMAAMKQCLAMAVLCFAINKLIDKKYFTFYLLVFIAMLFHAYAIMFAVLPIFTQKPWTIITYVAIIAIVFVIFTFESTITSFLEFAGDAGKEIDEQYVIGTESINLFRLAVFSVPPILSFIFQELLNESYDRKKHVMMNMSIISFLIMCLGLMSAANLFGRSAIYFELGTIIILPWLVKEMFSEESQKTGHILVGSCYAAFFAYSVIGFSGGYRALSVIEFIKTLV